VGKTAGQSWGTRDTAFVDVESHGLNANLAIGWEIWRQCRGWAIVKFEKELRFNHPALARELFGKTDLGDADSVH